MAGSSPIRRPDPPGPRIVALLAFTALGLLLAIVAWQPWKAAPGQSGSGDAGPGPTASGAVAGASPKAGAVASPGTDASPGAGPSVSPEPWADLALEPLVRVASLEADRPALGGVPVDATFTLTSLTDEPATALADRLDVTPTVKLAVATVAGGDKARITPARDLLPGTTYRFALRGNDGSLVGSWAFQVRGPVRVLSTLPGDRTTGVPRATGIEVTFDQEGVADMADHFKIEPAVKGRFERHGRTQVFVPASPLKAATVYTITVSKGLERAGTDLALESDVVYAFETVSTEQDVRGRTTIRPSRPVLEASPSEAPVIAVWISQNDPEGTIPDPEDVAVLVYRLPSLDAARKALTDYLRAPTWTEYDDPAIPTDGLPVVARFTAKLESLGSDMERAFRFPDQLPIGRYVVQIGTERPGQVFLQVVPVSAWVSVLTDRTVAWVNDVTTGRPIAGATIALQGGKPFGRSGTDGLVNAPTPLDLVPPAEAAGRDVPDVAPILEVASPSGETLLVPFGIESSGMAYRGEWWERWASGDPTYWSLLATDRESYRATDRVSAWGYLRGRDNGKVPAATEIRLVRDSGGTGSPPIASATVQPDRNGAWTASFAIERVPLGSYQVEMLVDGRLISRQWIQVMVIRKPAYRLEATTDHTAVISGTKVAWTVQASFFDGGAVPGLRVDYETGRMTTNASGRATVSLTARAGGGEGNDDWWMSFRPAGEESGDISTGGHVVVFPSALDVAATAGVQEGRLRISGDVHEVDLVKVEQAIAGGTWEGDSAGDAVRGIAVKAAVAELIPVRKKVGETYDYIEKVVVPRYEYSTQRKPVRTVSITSAAGGKISASLVVPDPRHDYEVVLTLKDSKGRVRTQTIVSGDPAPEEWADSGVRFSTPDAEPLTDTQYEVGERFAWTITNGGKPSPTGGANRYLYVVAQRGLKDAFVSAKPTFERRFAVADAPGVFVMGVRFTGTTYAPKAATWADLDPGARKLTVTVTPDRKRYRPGQDASLRVRVRNADGDPIAASVIVQAVDEKLYAMGLASTLDPLYDLHRRVDSGIVRLTASHQKPAMAGSEGEGGDTSGGGGDDGIRSDFRDTLLFQRVRTGADGTAVVKLPLSDDLTSWHVEASAVTAGLEAGVGSVLVPVGLPFFVEPVVADEYLAVDDPVISLRAFGDALRSGDRVEFNVSSKSLGMKPASVKGTAFTYVTVPLPALTSGRHTLTISARTIGRVDAAGKPYRDTVELPVRVLPTRVTSAAFAYATLGQPLPAIDGEGIATYTFSDAGRGRYLGPLMGLVWPNGVRIDRAIAQAIARDLLISEFGRDPATLPPDAFDPGRYLMGVEDDGNGHVTMGVALLPYGGRDPALATRIAMLAPDRLDDSELRYVLAAILTAPGTKRDLAIAATAGLAGLGDPVLDDLRNAAGASDLTATERLHLALGFEAVGDDAAALAIERDLLERYGERLGGWVRLRVSDAAAEIAAATALAAVVAAGLGDPLAPDLAAYVAANPSSEVLSALELAAAAERGIERTPATSASFAYSVDGKRTVVRLEPGEARTLELTAAQRRGLSVERLSGKVGVAVGWREPTDLAAIEPSADLTLTRTVPAGPIPTDRLVTVTLSATFRAAAPEDGCYEVVETVPSGLAPIEGPFGLGGTSQVGDRQYVWPTSIVGQEVRFCVSNPPTKGRTADLRYQARVVNQGSYAWEPAVIQLPGAPQLIAVTQAARRTIAAK